MLMTRRFEKEGYEVLGAGKLYHHNEGRYMQHHAGRFGGFGPLPEEKLTSFEGVRLWDWGVYPEADSLLPDHKISEWAVSQLQRDFTKPFFLGVGFFRPHVPLYTTKRWFDLFPAANVLLPKVNEQDLSDISEYAKNLTSLEHIEPPHEWIVENDEWKNLVRSYLACISFVDHQVGRVMHALESSSYKDNTYIVLVSDHGFHLGDKERWAKQTLWEVSTRAPLIVAGPGIAQGKTCGKPVQLLDIYPTVLELTGLAMDRSLEGHSIVPLIKDPDAEWPYIARSSFGPGNYAIRSEHYRYIRYNDGSEEFYDHRNDPLEWNNEIHNPKFQEVIDDHKTFLPESSFQILGSGSTGHKAYQAAEEITANHKRDSIAGE
jgi:arylsulfatase A-like enzyme